MLTPQQNSRLKAAFLTSFLANLGSNMSQDAVAQFASGRSAKLGWHVANRPGLFFFARESPSPAKAM